MFTINVHHWPYFSHWTKSPQVQETSSNANAFWVLQIQSLASYIKLYKDPSCKINALVTILYQDSHQCLSTTATPLGLIWLLFFWLPSSPPAQCGFRVLMISSLIINGPPAAPVMATSPCKTAGRWQVLCWQAEIENSWVTICRMGLNYRANPVDIHNATAANHSSALAVYLTVHFRFCTSRMQRVCQQMCDQRNGSPAGDDLFICSWKVF